jgi:hypothetical protein
VVYFFIYGRPQNDLIYYHIFLELIARYIIEKINPELSNMVEQSTKYCIKYNQYEEIFEQDRGVLATKE